MCETHMNAKDLMIILKGKKNKRRTEKRMYNASLKIDSLSYL
jgi:hypothetical protein